MTMEIDEMIAVLQAAKEGKEIEAQCIIGVDRVGTNFGDCLDPIWNFHDYGYRVKPEPKMIWAKPEPSTIWVKWINTRDAQIVVRGDLGEEYKKDFKQYIELTPEVRKALGREE